MARRGFGGALVAALVALALAAATARADDVYGDLDGFEDEAATADDLEGFDDDELGDDLGGFGEDDDFADVVIEDAAEPDERWWDVDGSVAVSTSIPYLSHAAPNGTDWTGLARFRTRLTLELDAELPRDFRLRLTPHAWYDFSYLYNGRGKFSDEVLDEYEWEVDFQDSYVEGALLPSLDVKIGRQVVNWGRSDSLRVVDVLNPLDNREPGRADIEDLRWSVGMAKLDWHPDRTWTLTAIAIPEIRFDDVPPFGSDFNPSPSPLPSEEKPDSFEHWEFAGALSGIFEGWDLSLHYAWIFQDLPRIQPVGPLPTDVVRVHDRVHMAGVGGNTAWDVWLVKGEIAVFHGSRYAVPGPLGLEVTDEKTSLASLVGVEYYGFTDTTLGLDVADRHVFGHEPAMRDFPSFVRENAVSYALRATSDWMNARLQTTLLALVFGARAQDGAVLRLQGDYTVRDGLVATVGMLIYQAGDLPPLDAWGRNDRIFIDVKYSF